MIILVFGLPGTGKSYFSRQFTKEIDAAYLNTDVVRDGLNKRGQYDRQSKEQVYEELMKRLRAVVKNGLDVLVDGTFHKQERRARVRAIGLEYDHPVFLIELKTQEETVKKRLENKRYYSESDFQMYQQIKQEWEPCREDHLRLWSDSSEMQHMIQQAQGYIYGQKID